MKTKLIILIATVLALPVLSQEKKKDAPETKQKEAAQPKTGAFLGIAMDPVTATTRSQLNLPEGIGVVVSYVAKGSPAEKGGLSFNDIITQMNDQLIVNPEQLQALIKTRKPGDEVTLTFYRNSKEQTAKIKLGKGEMKKIEEGQPDGLRLQDGQWKPFNVPRGLGLFNQFQLRPGNLKQMEEQMEELRKQLQNLPNFGPRGFRMDMFPNDELFEMPEPPEGNRKNFNFNAQVASSVTVADETGSYTLKTKNGKKIFSAKDKNGDELFTGPVDTEKQRDALDRNLIKKLEQLEGMGGGKGGLQFRQFKFDGGGQRNFNFDFNFRRNNPKEQPKPKKKDDKNRSEA
tara:strand:- start:1149 stop:2183 length:1035 start_codon:yes stop_codon:yes gene_type:complete